MSENSPLRNIAIPQSALGIQSPRCLVWKSETTRPPPQAVLAPDDPLVDRNVHVSREETVCDRIVLLFHKHLCC